jgi:hypothetical protein
MKKLKGSMLAAWWVMTAGVLTVAGQSGAVGALEAKNYPLNARFTDNPPKVVSVAGLPALTLTDLEPMPPDSITTDGSGKISGAQHARVYFGGPSNHTNNYAIFVIQAAGTIRTKGTAPWVKMTLKGHGFDVEGQTEYPNPSLSLKFTSASAPTIVTPNQPVTVTNSNYAVTYLDGSTVLFSDGPKTYMNQNPYYTLGGTIKGTIKSGKKSAGNAGKPLKINEDAALLSESWIWSVVNGTNFVQHYVGGSLVVNVLSNITGQVVQDSPATKFSVAGGVGSTLDPYSGTVTVDYNLGTYKGKLKGVRFAQGSVLDLSGTLGTLITGYEPVANVNYPTGYATNYVLDAIKGVSFSGKVIGQKVPLTSGVNLDAPFPTGF